MTARSETAAAGGDAVAADADAHDAVAAAPHRRGEPRFYAFDLLSCNGEDLRYFPLADRKHRLRGVVPHGAERLLYCDHIEERGEHLFRLVLKRDLEGIVAKRRDGAYLPDSVPDWLKIRNRSYSQWIGREKLFERERKSNPDAHFGSWDQCVLACAAAAK